MTRLSKLGLSFASFLLLGKLVLVPLVPLATVLARVR
jgi:hypothetical protein